MGFDAELCVRLQLLAGRRGRVGNIRVSGDVVLFSLALSLSILGTGGGIRKSKGTHSKL